MKPNRKHYKKAGLQQDDAQDLSPTLSPPTSPETLGCQGASLEDLGVAVRGETKRILSGAADAKSGSLGLLYLRALFGGGQLELHSLG